MTAVKRLCINILVALISCIVVFAPMELGVRIFNPRQVRTYFDEQTIKALGDPVPPKKAGEYRIFIFGGSSAYGFPLSDRSSITVWLRRSFPCLLPGRDIRVINCAWPGRGSIQALEGARAVLKYKPDLFIVYSGHNDSIVANRLYLDNKLYWASFRLEYMSAAYRYLIKRFNRVRKKILYGRSGYAEKEYREETIAKKVYKKIELTEAEYEKVRKGYQKNMEALIRLAKRKGVDVLFVNLPSNLRDIPPSYSLHAPGLTPAQLTEWEIHYESGNKFMKAGLYQPALEAFERALKIDNSYAELTYRTAQSYDKLGCFDQAKKYYIWARDLDARPWRAKSSLNETICHLVEQNHLMLADAISAFEKVSPQGIIGSNIIYDNIHPSVKGQQIISDSILDVLCQNNQIAPRNEWQWKAFSDVRENKQKELWDFGESWEAYRYILRGFFLWEQKRYEDVAKDLEKGLVLMPAYYESYAFLGDAYWHLGRPEKAAATFRTLMEKDAALGKQVIEKYPDIAKSYKESKKVQVQQTH